MEEEECSKETSQVISSTDESSIRDNIAKLSNCSSEVRSLACEALQNLACNEANRDATRVAQGITPLVGLLRDPNEGVRKYAAGALGNLASNMANKDAIREAQGIVPLVEQLKDPSTAVRENAAGALGNLAYNKQSNREVIREAQGITPLVGQLQDTNTAVRKNAAGALGNLALNMDNSDAIREAQGIAPLVTQLQDPNIDLRENAAGALQNLARKNEANKDAIREAQSIAPLVSLLRDPNTRVRKRAAGALMNLASNESNRDAIREAQGIAPLLAQLQDPDTTLRENATGALSNLAYSNYPNQDAIRLVQGISLLVGQLKDPNTAVRKKASQALKNLADKHHINQAAMVDAGAIPALRTLASSDVNARKTLAVCEALVESRKQPDLTNMPTFISIASNVLHYVSSSTSHDSTIIFAQATRFATVLPGEQVDRSPAPLNNVPIIAASALQLDRLYRIGEGYFGVVYRGSLQRVTVAVKKLHATRLSQESLASFQEEAQRHVLLCHPNIVMLYGVCIEPGNYSMVMEFMTGGSLYSFLHNTQDILWSVRLAIAQNIAKGLYYLHVNNIIHRELKSLNVLLDDRGQAKLADFGLAIVKAESKATTTNVSAHNVPGTLRWMAPELFQRWGKCTQSSDIYALGWVLWEIAARKIPFQDEEHATDAVIIQWIKDGERELIPDATPKSYTELIKRCWQQRSSERPTANQVAAALDYVELTPVGNVASGYQFYSR